MHIFIIFNYKDHSAIILSGTIKSIKLYFDQKSLWKYDIVSNDSE